MELVSQFVIGRATNAPLRRQLQAAAPHAFPAPQRAAVPPKGRPSGRPHLVALPSKDEAWKDF